MSRSGMWVGVKGISVRHAVVSVVLEQRFVILPTVENAQDKNIFGSDCKSDHGSFFVVCDSQPWSNVIALIASLREYGQTFAITDDPICVAHGNGW